MKKAPPSRALLVGGDIVRGASALGATISSAMLYEDIKGEALYKQIGSVGRDVGGALTPFLGTYGIGEVINAVKDYTLDLKMGRKPGMFEHAKRLLTTAPILSPMIYYFTNGDFTKSIVAPIAACIAGHLIGYVGRAINKRSKAEVELTREEMERLLWKK